MARGLAKLACNMQNEHVQIEESLGQVCSDIFTDKQCINPVRCIQQQLLLLKKGGKKYMSDCKVNGAWIKMVTSRRQSKQLKELA